MLRVAQTVCPDLINLRSNVYHRRPFARSLVLPDYPQASTLYPTETFHKPDFPKCSSEDCLRHRSIGLSNGAIGANPQLNRVRRRTDYFDMALNIEQRRLAQRAGFVLNGAPWRLHRSPEN